MKSTCKKRIISMLMALSFLLITGCSEKVEEIEYVTKDTSEKNIHGIGSFPETDNGECVWEDQYAIGDIPVEMNVRKINYDQNPIYQRKITPIRRNEIRDDIIASRLFGDSMSSLKRAIDEDDPYLMVNFCKSFQMVFNREQVKMDKNGVAISYIFDEVPTWEDGEDYFYHIFEGMIDGVKYWLFIGFREDNHILSIGMWPYNPGEVIGNPKYSQMGLFDQYTNIVLSDGSDMYQRLYSRNRTDKNETSLCEKAEQFSIEKLMMRIDKYDCKASFGDSDLEAVYYCTNDLSTQRYDESVVDGFAVYYSATKNHYRTGMWIEDYGNCMDVGDVEVDVYDEKRNWLSDNFGVFYVHEGGVIGCNLQFSFMAEEGEVAETLDFNTTKSAFEKNIRSHLETDGIKGNRVTCRRMSLLSLPNQPEGNGTLLIPVWQFELMIDDQYTFAYLYQSAVDGSLISIQYL